MQRGAFRGRRDRNCVLVRLWDELCGWTGELEVACGLSDDFCAVCGCVGFRVCFLDSRIIRVVALPP